MTTPNETSGTPRTRRVRPLVAAVVGLAVVGVVVALLVSPDPPADDPDEAAPDREAPPDPQPDDTTEDAVSVDVPEAPWSSVHPYSADSPWNTPLPADAPVHPDTDAFLERIEGPLTSDVSQYTLPVYEVDGDTPTVPVRLLHLFSDVDAHGTGLDRIQTPTVEVPIPDRAAAARGSDAQIVVVNTDTGEEWGFWQLQPEDDGFVATNGYRYHVDWNAVPPDGFGSRGAGVPYLTGLIRPDDIERGRIEHAIAFAYPTPSPEFVFPATKSDGPGEAGVDLPEGARLRLDPSLDEQDLRELGLEEEGLVIARALQEYGMILIDIAGRPKIYAEYDETAGWDGRIDEDTISALPMDAFEVIDWEAHEHAPLAQPTAQEPVPLGGDVVLDATGSIAPDGEITAFEWTDGTGDPVGDEPILRRSTDGLTPGVHPFLLRVRDDEGRWSLPRLLPVEVAEVDGPFVSATHEATGLDTDRLELPAASFGDDELAVVAVTVRRVNPQDEVGVTRIEGDGRRWQRAIRESDDGGNLGLEIWFGTPANDGAAEDGTTDNDGGLELRLSAGTNVSAQALGVAGVGPVADFATAQTGSEATETAELELDAPADGLVLGFHAGRTEDFSPADDLETNVLNTVADAEGGSVRTSTVLSTTDDERTVPVRGTTRSPMEWVLIGLSFEAAD
ncbi:hypothetical protein [Egicoccus halophilus]|nr:hypothetical protein [Egicoccus halophilus]